MKKLLFLSILVFNITFFCSCEDITILDVASSLLSSSGSSSPPVDETNLTLRPEFDWRVANETSRLFVDNNTKFISTGEEGVNLRDVETGELLWTWNDYVNLSRGACPKEGQYYIKDNLLLFFNTARYHCIDLKTGETKWKKEIADKDRMDDQEMTGAEDYYFQIGTIELDSCIGQDAIYVGNIHNADTMQLVVAPKFQEEILISWRHKYGLIEDIEAFQNSYGDILLGITSVEPVYETDTALWLGDFNNYLSLWNFTQKKWVYKNIFTWRSRTIANLKKINDLLYCYSRDQLRCFDLNGNELWSREVGKLESMEVEFSNDYILFVKPDNIYELVKADNGKIVWVYGGECFKEIKLSKKHLYLQNDNIKIYDLESRSLLKTIDNPYDDYPKENYKYFKKGLSIKAIEKANGEDQIILNTTYMFGMTFNGEKSDG